MEECSKYLIERLDTSDNYNYSSFLKGKLQRAGGAKLPTAKCWHTKLQLGINRPVIRIRFLINDEKNKGNTSLGKRMITGLVKQAFLMISCWTPNHRPMLSRRCSARISAFLPRALGGNGG